MLGRLTARTPLLHGGAAPREGPSAETASVQREEEAPGGQHRLARRERGTRGTRDTLGSEAQDPAGNRVNAPSGQIPTGPGKFSLRVSLFQGRGGGRPFGGTWKLG